MALINCPECNKEVSDKAATCPNCGVAIKKGKFQEVLDAGKKHLPTAQETGKKYFNALQKAGKKHLNALNDHIQDNHAKEKNFDSNNGEKSGNDSNLVESSRKTSEKTPTEPLEEQLEVEVIVEQKGNIVEEKSGLEHTLLQENMTPSSEQNTADHNFYQNQNRDIQYKSQVVDSDSRKAPFFSIMRNKIVAIVAVIIVIGTIVIAATSNNGSQIVSAPTPAPAIQIPESEYEIDHEITGTQIITAWDEYLAKVGRLWDEHWAKIDILWDEYWAEELTWDEFEAEQKRLDTELEAELARLEAELDTELAMLEESFAPSEHEPAQPPEPVTVAEPETIPTPSPVPYQTPTPTPEPTPTPTPEPTPEPEEIILTAENSDILYEMFNTSPGSARMLELAESIVGHTIAFDGFIFNRYTYTQRNPFTGASIERAGWSTVHLGEGNSEDGDYALAFGPFMRMDSVWDNDFPAIRSAGSMVRDTGGNVHVVAELRRIESTERRPTPFLILVPISINSR